LLPRALNKGVPVRDLLTCVGEILIDFLPIEEHNETVGFRMRPGGGPFNVAVGLARLGRPTAFAARLADDFFGHQLGRYLAQQGISADFLIADQSAPTTLAFVASEDGEPAFTFYGEGAADTRLTSADLPAAFFERTAILHFGGISLLRGSTPDTVEAAIGRLSGQALISFDPNMRPALVRDEAAYRARIDRCLTHSDLLKVSAADLAWLAPGRPAEEVARELLSQGPAMITLTLGGDGAVALRASEAGVERIQADGFPIKVVDTVGAGDSFSAGMLAALHERGVASRAALLALPAAAVAECLRFAAAAAAITCTRLGADPPTRDQVVGMLAG
jgi:fructokinase